jgi:hypothetical protein
MAIVQISQIQIRRGLQQDLPQLASAEMGWSLDTRRLFIGNGTLDEGAPTTGVTEILTEHSNFLGFVSSYTFAGTDSGYTSQTGPTILSPVTRSLQSVLDDMVSVRDFGAVADDTTDNTTALNRAIQQIYVSGINGTHRNVQRTIKIPAGTYVISSPLLIPPNCTLVGDGKNNTMINASGTAFALSDSYYQTGGFIGAAVGSNTPVLPGTVLIKDLTVHNVTNTDPVVVINKATDVKFENVEFNGGNYNIQILDSSTTDIKFVDCKFINYNINPMSIDSQVAGVVTKTGAFDTTHVTLSTGTTTIASLSTGAGVIKYQINDSSNNYRIGELKYNNTGSVTKFDDEYTEPGVPLTANLFASASGTLSCTVTGNYTFKYNIKQFI